MGYIIAPIRSWFSLRSGVEPPEMLAPAIAARGFSGGILADGNILTGQLGFAASCRELGITGGAGVNLEIGGRKVVLVALRGGWSQLCVLVTSVMLPRRISLEDAIVDSSNLIALTGSPEDAAFLEREMGFRGKLFVGVLPERISGTAPGAAEREIVHSGQHPLAVWPVMFSKEDSLRTHMVLRRGYLNIEGRRLDPCEFATEAGIVPDAGLFHRSFRDAGRSLRNNLKMAEMLATQPEATCKERRNVSEEEEHLEMTVRSMAASIYAGSPAAARRMEMELDCIRENGLSGYFLRFYEIVQYCRSSGISVSARGSAGGSIVAYLLGISIICPLQHDLSFARFFNVLRSSPPDIDLDIDSSRRDQVIKWFLDRFGRRAAAVSQVVTHRERSAFRVAASAMGIGSEETDALSKLIRHRGNIAWKRPAAMKALRDSELLLHLPSHLAPHPCGLVCTSGPVDSIVPLHPSAIGYDMVQFDKDGTEEMGLLKMDLLGQRGLTTVSITCSELGRSPMDVFRRGGKLDPGARELLDSGRTIGVVHVESPAMRGLLREMRIATMEDVARALALVRPGASAGGGRRDYMQCLYAGGILGSCLPELRPVLRENLGVMLYQEDVSKAAAVLLGLDEASSDLLRRKLKRKQVDEEEIISICRRKCMSPGKAKRIWETLSGYAGYGFCKAHAFTYAAVACGAAALKKDHPALYMASVMAAGGGFYSARTYLEEARRLGVEFRPPGVNSGKWLSRQEDGMIVPGFHFLKGMGISEYDKLRSGRPYRYPSEVLESGCGISLCRSMAAAGCFREIGFTPPSAMIQLESGSGGFFQGGEPGSPGLPDYSAETRLAMELGLLGLPLSLHPMQLLKAPDGTMPICEIPDRGSFRIWGRMVTGRRLKAGAGFLMLEDSTGVADVFLPSPFHGMAESILVRGTSTIIVRGRIERGNRIRALSVEPGPLTVQPLEPEPPEK